MSTGSIVYMYHEGSKLKARPRYVVLKVDKGWVTLRRFAEQRLGNQTYTAKLEQCYVVPEEVDAYEDLPPYPNPGVIDDDDDRELYHPTPAQTQPRHQSDVDDSGESSGSEDADDDDRRSEVSEEEIAHCALCHREVKEEHNGLLCDTCSTWSHRNCLKMKKKEYKELTKNGDFNWNCPACPPVVEVEVDEVEEIHPVPPDQV